MKCIRCIHGAYKLTPRTIRCFYCNVKFIPMERKDRILRVGRIREEEFLADLINAWNSTTCLIHECPSEIPKLGPIATRLAQTMENFQRAKQCNLKIDCFRDDLGRVSFQVKAKDEIGFLKWKRKQE